MELFMTDYDLYFISLIFAIGVSRKIMVMKVAMILIIGVKGIINVINTNHQIDECSDTEYAYNDVWLLYLRGQM